MKFVKVLDVVMLCLRGGRCCIFVFWFLSLFLFWGLLGGVCLEFRENVLIVLELGNYDCGCLVMGLVFVCVKENFCGVFEDFGRGVDVGDLFKVVDFFLRNMEVLSLKFGLKVGILRLKVGSLKVGSVGNVFLLNVC